MMISDLEIKQNPFLRVVGRDKPASQVMTAALEKRDLPIEDRSTPPMDDDYTQIDLALSRAGPNEAKSALTPPTPGTGYAGLTTGQRYDFLEWLRRDGTSTDPAFQQLYIAHLEVGLFATRLKAKEIQLKTRYLHIQPAWQENILLQRLLLLQHWLMQDGERLASWLSTQSIDAQLMGVALGHLALLNTKLDGALLSNLIQTWNIVPTSPSEDILKLRLASLTTDLEAEPLQYALSQLSKAELLPQPWRCAHRDIRIALPQPNLRPVLEPLLREIIAIVDVQTENADSIEEESPAGSTNGQEKNRQKKELEKDWHMVIEFGESRSEFFDHVLFKARKLPGYTQLMDENRQIIYRVVLSKREKRQFWQLWDYIQNWSTTRVYVNGRELRKWDIYPYSPFLQ